MRFRSNRRLYDGRSNRDRCPRGTLATVMSLLTLLLLILPARASEPYTLDVQDRLRVYVAEWPALNVEVAIGANGSVALPLIGEIPARGLEPAELASSIATRLQEKSRQPSACTKSSTLSPNSSLAVAEKASTSSWAWCTLRNQGTVR